MRSSLQAFILQLLPWAKGQADILGILLVGSQAHGAARPDSDIDLVIASTTPSTYIDNVAWTAEFGKVDRTQIEDYGKLTSVRVWYKSGLEVEFGFTDRSWTRLPLDPGTKQVLDGGYRLLFERKDFFSPLKVHK